MNFASAIKGLRCMEIFHNAASMQDVSFCCKWLVGCTLQMQNLLPNDEKMVATPGFSRCSRQFARPFLGLSCFVFHFNQPVHDSQAVSDKSVPWQCNATAETAHYKL